MAGIALLIVFVVFIPIIRVYAAAFIADWCTPVVNQVLAHARRAFHTFLFKFISDRTSGPVVAFNWGFLTASVWNRTSESKFDNLSMSDVRIRVMLSPTSSQKTLKP